MLERGAVPRSSQTGLQKFVQQAIAPGLPILADFKVETPEVVAGAVMNVFVAFKVDEIIDISPPRVGLRKINGAAGQPVLGGETFLIREDCQSLAELGHGLTKVFLAFIFAFGHAHNIVAGKLCQFETRTDHPGLGIH